MSMIDWFIFLLVPLLAMPGSNVPSLSPVDKLVAPARLSDAVFAEGNQIVALTSQTSNLPSGERRCFLSVWDIGQRKWLLTKPMDALPPSVSCGRLGYSTPLHRITITADSDLLLVIPESLELDKKVSVSPNHIATIGPQGSILYALSERGHLPITLTSYLLPTGTLIQKKALSGMEFSLSKPLRVAVVSNEQLAFLQSDAEPLGVPEKNSTLAICNENGMACNTVPVPMPVANFLASGDSLLFVADDIADHSSRSVKQCIAKLALATLRVDSQAYCRPDAGVHYSLSTLGSDFVLGYSGYGARRGWLDDGLVVSKSSSISVWDAKSARLLAIAPLSHGKSFTLTSSVIQADTSGKKRFLFYNLAEEGEILLYDLSSLGR